MITKYLRFFTQGVTKNRKYFCSKYIIEQEEKKVDLEQ